MVCSVVCGVLWWSVVFCGGLWCLVPPPLSNSCCSSEPFSYAAIEQDCTLGLVIQILNGSYDAGIDVVFPHGCP